MRRVYLYSLLLTSLLVTCLPINAKNHLPELKRRVQNCVKCGWDGDCRSCVGEGFFKNCRTPDCNSCDQSNRCTAIGTDPILDLVAQDVPENPRVKSEDRKVLRLTSKVIKEIAKAHPRFGATLANLNMFGLTASDHEIHWTPIKLRSEDINAFLDRKSNQKFFRKYNEEGRRINRLIRKGQLEEIVYKVTIKQENDASWTIDLQVKGNPALSAGDPVYNSLMIRAVYDRVSIDSEKPDNVTWEIK